ncbi:hypothetical protein HYV30_03780 [Candidatus Kaiserbacteria bacterium]|nr:hypothetical protein [Candidatus Kaiserbacteria bacterium]
MATILPRKLTGLSEEEIQELVPGLARLGLFLEFADRQTGIVKRSRDLPTNARDTRVSDPGAESRWRHIDF